MAAATSETKHGVTLESDDAWVAAVLKDEPSLSESDARRYLVARKGDYKKARAMLEADVKWRAQAKPELVSQAQILPVLDGGCWRQIGSTSTSGFPVLWIQLSLWEPHLYSAETYGLNACYWMEKLTQIQERFIVLFDLAGWRLSHALHLRKVHTLVHTLQDHYPERLQAALLMRAPFIFSSFWALVKPVIDPVTAAKVHFVNVKLEAETLASHDIPASILPNLYGGDREGEELPFPNLPGEPDLTHAKAAAEEAAPAADEAVPIT